MMNTSRVFHRENQVYRGANNLHQYASLLRREPLRKMSVKWNTRKVLHSPFCHSAVERRNRFFFRLRDYVCFFLKRDFERDPYGMTKRNSFDTLHYF